MNLFSPIMHAWGIKLRLSGLVASFRFLPPELSHWPRNSVEVDTLAVLVPERGPSSVEDHTQHTAGSCVAFGIACLHMQNES